MRSSFSSEDEVAITVAPMARAICRAKMDTPPVPSTSTVSLAFSWPSTTRARQAVSPAVVRVAASAWLKGLGAWVNQVAGRTAQPQA